MSKEIEEMVETRDKKLKALKIVLDKEKKENQRLIQVYDLELDRASKAESKNYLLIKEVVDLEVVIEKEKERADRAKEHNYIDLECMSALQSTIEGLEEKVKELEADNTQLYNYTLTQEGAIEALMKGKIKYKTITIEEAVWEELVQFLESFEKDPKLEDKLFELLKAIGAKIG